MTEETSSFTPVRSDTAAIQSELHFVSSAQERLWFLDRIHSLQTAYNVPLAVRIHGPLRIVVLEQALQKLTERHAMFRTTFVETNDGIRQRVRAAAFPTLEEFDVATATDREAAAETILMKSTARPFD